MMKYSYKKVDAETFEVYLHNGKGDSMFVCNIYQYEILDGMTKAEFVDSLIKDAGYIDRADYYNHNKPEHEIEFDDAEIDWNAIHGN